MLIRARIEPATVAEAGYVAKTIKRMQRWDGRFAEMTHDEFWELWNGRVGRMFLRGAECHVALALHREDRFVYGFVVFEPHRLHYLFVRPSFRRHEIAKELLRLYHGPKVYTCETRMSRLAKKRGWEKVNAPDLD